MNWVVLSILSALFLGVYDLIKKAGVRDNAVPPVLFFSVLAGALVWTPFLCWSMVSPESFPLSSLLVRPMSWKEHGFMLAKSTLVSTSWVFNYFAVKHLPVSVGSPIRATAPLWTILMAVTAFGERPAFTQWMGITIILSGFYAFSFVGKLEGIHFHRNRWVGFMMMATWLGALSALYDKYLLQNRGMEPATVQCWFSIYLTVVLGPFYALWRFGKVGKSVFHWRWCIPMIGITLLAADFFYFVALSDQDALISIVSPLRRCAVLITFFGGIIAYREKNMRPKLVCILIILAGIFVLKWSS